MQDRRSASRQERQEQLQEALFQLKQTRIERQSILEDELHQLEQDRLERDRELMEELAALERERLEMEKELELERLQQKRSLGLECIRETIGYLPDSPLDLTDAQISAIDTSCPIAAQSLANVLDPDAVDESNRKCIQRVIGYIPLDGKEMTTDDSKRVQQLCFGGTHISDSNAPERGVFSNSTRGPLGSANATDPALLAVIGIVITLGATVLQLIRGN